MKRILFLSVLLSFHSNLLAGSFLFGLNIRSVYSSGDKNSFDIKIGPALLYKVSENWEISPSIGFIRTYSTVSQDYQDFKMTQYSIWGECGLYRHFIKSETYRFSLGPNIIFEKKFKPKTEMISNNGTTEITPTNYNNFVFGLSMPINVDFVFNNKLILRLSSKVIRADFNYSNGSGTFKFEIESFPLPSFMLFICF
jgi:hypothetical protein